MKSLILILPLFFFSMVLVPRLHAQGIGQAPHAEVETAVRSFVQAGDERDVQQLDAVLHEGYRVILHQAFGNPGTEFWDKATYVDMIKSEKIGGEPRDLTFTRIDVMDNLATAKVLLRSSKLEFESNFTLVRNQDGAWQIISDMAKVTPIG